MYHKFLLSFFALFLTHILLAQNITLSGIIKDTTADKLVKNAVVAVLSQKDSSLINFTRTKEDGSYLLQKLPSGKYIFMVMHPAFADYVEDIEIKNEQEKMPLIAVTPKSKLLEAVILKSGNPIRIKGDTTIYTADSFKVSANANVEELLKKMPGIQVDKNGEIKAMGETVEKVLVDGEEFFGDDPGMAIKNLRADAVKEVQVFKKKSDQAEFTGIDDGQSKQTINLKLKENKKTGYFGKIDAAGGLQQNIDDRYNTNLMFSSFKGKRKLSAYLLNGNTGQDGLSWQDMDKYGGNDNMNMVMDDDGGMMFYGRGGGSDGEPYVNTENGFTTNLNAGVQYSNKWNDKTTLNFSPKFNSQVYDNILSRYSQTQLGDSLLIDSAETISHVNRNNLKTNLSYEIKIDTNNTIKLTLLANIYHTESEELSNSKTTGENGNFKNGFNRLLQTNSDKQSYTGTILFKHRFKKARRTITFNSEFNQLNNDANNFLKSSNEAYEDGLPPSKQLINQMTDFDKSSQNFVSKLVYTEPLSKKYALELGHEMTYNSGKNNQVTYDYSPASDKYDVVVDSLTNDFDQSSFIHKSSLKISYADKKIKFNFGSAFGFTHIDRIDNTINESYSRKFTNIFPQASFTYSYKSNHSLRVSYNGSTKQPTFNQLQPLINNSNYYNQYIGNPYLNPSFSNAFNISHNAYNFLKEMYSYQGLYGNITSNAITNNKTTNLSTGQTITQPINTNGNMNLGFYGGVGLKIKKIKTDLNISPNFNYSKFADVINSEVSFAQNLGAGIEVGIGKSKDKKYDFRISNNFTINSNKTSQTNTKDSYTSNTLSLNATVYYKKVWSLSSDYEYFYRQKTPQFNNSINNNLWNAKIQRTIKKNEFTAYFKMHDILNQNIGITRNFYSNTVSQEINQRLKRYWLLGVTWDFKNKAPKAKEEIKP